jgi:flagellar assembly factor FliW
MTTQNALVEPTAAQQPPVAIADEYVTVGTRFGDIEFHLENAIYMPRGMLGYADFHDFGLANLPDPSLEQFKLLQSLVEPELSFIVAPLNPEGDTIETDDIALACEALSIDVAAAIVLLVVSTRQIGPTTQISVNLRAPVLVDGNNRKAYQHVLMNNKYPVRQVIGTAAQKASEPGG